MDSRLIFTPEDRERGAPEAEMAKALAEGRAENERWHLRKDGSRFWGSGLLLPLGARPRAASSRSCATRPPGGRGTSGKGC